MNNTFYKAILPEVFGYGVTAYSQVSEADAKAKCLTAYIESHVRRQCKAEGYAFPSERSGEGDIEVPLGRTEKMVMRARRDFKKTWEWNGGSIYALSFADDAAYTECLMPVPVTALQGTRFDSQ